MVRKIIISVLILHGLYVTISNSIIDHNVSRTLEKALPLKAIAETKNLLQEGDMVFRLNMDGYSQYIKQFNRKDKQYSHAGIIIIEDGQPFVYHMVNGEENTANKMTKHLFEEFVDPKKNYAFGIYRNEMLPKEILSMVTQIKQWYIKGVEFDFEFDYKSDSKMYCSEMIAKAVSKATLSRIEINSTKLLPKEAVAFAAFSKLNLEQTRNLKVIAIDNLYTHKWCNVIREYRYY